jgi:hypothetical protein
MQVKEQKTAHQLANRIKERLGREVFIWVNKDPVYGWHAIVYAPAMKPLVSDPSLTKSLENSAPNTI